MAEFTIDASDFGNLADLDVNAFLTATGVTVVEEMRDSMRNTRTGPRRLSKSRSGRALKRGVRARRRSRSLSDRGDRLHQPSLPGNPPAVDKGILINSLNHRKASATTRTVHGAEHGLFLDRDKDRPFIDPAIERVIKNDIEGLAEAHLFKR